VETRPNFERLRTAINCQEPDRVPIFEGIVELPIQSLFLGREVAEHDVASQVEFWTKAGYDYVPVVASTINPGKVKENARISKVIREVLLKHHPDAADERSWSLEYRGFINGRKDFNDFPWELAAHVDLTTLEEVGKLLPDGMKTIAISGKIFTLTWMLMGFNNFGMKLILDETLVADVFQKVGEIQLKALDKALSMEHVGAVLAADDLAFGTGPIISPEAFRIHVFPWYREAVRRCHERGCLFILHSDGNLTALMKDIIDCGVDMVQAIDPTCMDIFKMKREYSGRIAMAGNVPNELLRSGTPEEVAKYTRRLLKEVAPGGGFALGSGNSVTAWSKFDNYMAMRNTALQFGSYSAAARKEGEV
jgi:uroporphyrinogen decarboxylase